MLSLAELKRIRHDALTQIDTLYQIERVRFIINCALRSAVSGKGTSFVSCPEFDECSPDVREHIMNELKDGGHKLILSGTPEWQNLSCSERVSQMVIDLRPFFCK